MPKSAVRIYWRIITNYYLISKDMNGSLLILMNELLNFGKNIGCCETNGFPFVFIAVNRHPTSLEQSMPFLNMCTSLLMSLSHFSGDFHKMWCIFDLSFSDWLQNCYTLNTQLQINDLKVKQIDLHKIVYTGCQDMLVLSSTVALYHCNYWQDGSTNPEYFWYHLWFICHVRFLTRIFENVWCQREWGFWKQILKFINA